jgi:hypothetical protein
MGFAHVDSIDALKELRAALWKFTEAANQSLSEGEADLQRTINWLEHEARHYWQGQIKRRTTNLGQAKQALAAKRAFARTDGTRQAAIEEQQAVAKAEQRLGDATDKLERCRQWARKLQREALQYRGLMQRLVTLVQMEIPAASGHLDALVASLEEYAAIKSSSSDAQSGSLAASSGEATASMARAPEDAEAPAPAKRVDAASPEVSPDESSSDNQGSSNNQGRAL